MTLYKPYTGIGSRETPDEVLEIMSDVAYILSDYGYTLRSGAANGADSAFEFGCICSVGKREIYLPWEGFNNNSSNLYHISDEAFAIAEKHHPSWNLLREDAKKLHARNTYQILGYQVNHPSLFVICYAHPQKGGTLQALRISRIYNIPVINLYKEYLSIDEILDKVLIKRKKLTICDHYCCACSQYNRCVDETEKA